MINILKQEEEINLMCIIWSQLTTKSISSTSESELESRVRALTESLIQKQTILEALSTEKNSLILQLERLGVRKTSFRYTKPVNPGDTAALFSSWQG